MSPQGGRQLAVRSAGDGARQREIPGVALVEAADRALYHAKGHGRDRVSLAPD